MKTLKTSTFVEKSLFIAGVALLAFWLLARLDGKLSSQAALSAAASQSEPARSYGDVDFSLWAEKRIAAYRNSLSVVTEPPLAVLEITKVHIRVPVFEGTGDLVLNRGVGRIDGTAKFGTDGNVGIAGHRDGFFRGLKDVSLGDEVDLETATEKTRYVVDQIEIVDPSNVEVLQPRRAASLTLVTCFPFDFVGDAPMRFIVHASIAPRDPILNSGHRPQSSSAVKEKNKENQDEFKAR